jgi:tetratricopeptide (TPR) repeat protein
LTGTSKSDLSGVRLSVLGDNTYHVVREMKNTVKMLNYTQDYPRLLGGTTEHYTLANKVLIAIFALGTFIAISYITYFLVFSEMDGNVRAVISIVSGSIGFYIVLACFNIIKEFTFKGAGIEFTSKLDEVKGEVNKSRAEVKEKIGELTQHIMTTQFMMANTRADAKSNVNLTIALDKIARFVGEKKDDIVDNTLPAKADEKPMVPISEDLTRHFQELSELDDQIRSLRGAVLGENIRKDPAEIKKEADFHFFAKDWAKADELYKQLLDLEPSHDAIIKRVRALINLHRFDDAKLLYEEAIARWGKDPIKMSLVATAYARMKKREEAQTLIEEALKLSNNSIAVLYNAACVYSLLDSKQHALNYLEEVMKKDTGYFKNKALIDEDLSNIRQEKRFKELIQ